MDKNAPILKVDGLNVYFNGHRILHEVSFDVPRDDTLAVIGPNGAGKTILFKCLLGLVQYNGKVQWHPDTRIGYVPQKLLVSKDVPVTVRDFLSYKTKDMGKINNLLQKVGFRDNDNHHQHQGRRLLGSKLGVLSGGELQRVMIAFALLGDPNVLLFDEPTSGVDISAEETVYHLISNLKKEKDLTIIFISHELEVVYKFAEHVLCLNKEKICFGPPSIAIDEENLRKLYGEDIHFYHHNHTH